MEFRPLIDVRNWFLLNILTEFNQILYTLYHWQDLCLYSKGSFFTNLQQELQPLIDVRNCFLLNILRTDGQISTKFCIYITIDMIYPLSVLQPELCSWTYLWYITDSFVSGPWSHPLTILVFAGNKNNHEVSHEFKIWPDQTIVCGVSCSWTSEKIFYLHVLENYSKYFYDMLARRWAIVALWATCLTRYISKWSLIFPIFIYSGYCGADVRALCTEAALLALRRRYPQIYTSSEKLQIDVSTINVSAKDFYNGMRNIVPTAQRSVTSPGRSLSVKMAPLLQPILMEILSALGEIFPSVVLQLSSLDAPGMWKMNIMKI